MNRPALVAAPALGQPHITVELRQQYGHTVIVPVCATGELFLRLTGTKTLTKAHVETIKALGYEVRVKQTLPSTL